MSGKLQIPPAEGDAVGGARASGAAYGVALVGLDEAARLLRPVEPSWPVLRARVVRLDAPATHTREHLSDHDARYRLAGGGFMAVERATGRCTLAIPPGARMPSAADLVHPYLTTPLATIRSWADSDVFHGGAFVAGGRAWIVPGTKGAGKSTLLGALATLGADVLADDLAVVDHASVLAGPACVDLRGDAAAALGIGTDLGVVGRRRRWRHELPPVPSRIPLGGVLSLAWGGRTVLRPLHIDDRIRLLLTNVALRPAPPAPDTLLEIARMPSYVFGRRRDLGSVTASAEYLLEALGG